MPETDNEADIVGTLRSKVGESDIKQYLKNTLGGYTKSSVLDYLNLLRRQQQVTAETFVRNQQVLFDEKENLRKANDGLKAKLSRAETDYRELSDSVKVNEIEDSNITPSDFIALKNRATALEDELAKSGNEKNLLKKQLEHQEAVFDELAQKLEHAEQEKLSLRELIKSETQKKNELNTAISRLTGTIEEKDGEIKFLNSRLSEGRLAELAAKVGELTEQLASQTEMLAAVNGESSLKQQTVEALTEENAALKKRVAEQAKNIEELSAGNEKCQAACRALTEQLENEYRRSIALIRERSDVTMEKLETARKLDETASKLSLLELKMKKLAGSRDTDAVYESADHTGRIASDCKDTLIKVRP